MGDALNGGRGRKPGRLRRLRAEAVPLLAMLVLLGAARSSFANHYTVPSGSMEPALVPGDRIAVDMTAYGLRVPFTDIALVERPPPRPGDVVVFDSPQDGTRLVKRVVATGGQRVGLRAGRLTIDGRPLQAAAWPPIERFGSKPVALNLDAGGGPDIAPMTVPEGYALVLGDAELTNGVAKLKEMATRQESEVSLVDVAALAARLA